MSQQVLAQSVVIANRQGFHARPANQFVKAATQFDAKIEVVKGAERIDGKSILGLLTLGAEQGTELSIEATGPDAQEALKALVRLVESGFDSDEAASPS